MEYVIYDLLNSDEIRKLIQEVLIRCQTLPLIVGRPMQEYGAAQQIYSDIKEELIPSSHRR